MKDALKLKKEWVNWKRKLGNLIWLNKKDKNACTISQKLEILKEQIKFVSPKTSAECLEKINKILIDFESI